MHPYYCTVLTHSPLSVLDHCKRTPAGWWSC
jgi:hypothetical protein